MQSTPLAPAGGAEEKRIVKEIRATKSDQTSGVVIEPEADSLLHLKGSFSGPSGTPYEGGAYVVDIIVPEGYPFRPPVMRLVTKIWHPNISSQTGAICLDILKDAWAPSLTIRAALISLQSMLNEPMPESPQDAQVASMYLNNRELFLQTAREWCDRYAKPAFPSSARQDASSLIAEDTGEGLPGALISTLCDMGFPRPRVIECIRRVNGDQDKAVDLLLSS